MSKLSGKIFNEELNESVVHETVRWLLASRRQGTHSAKTRSEVSGGGIKPWKQKGTGRARAGSIRSPLWRKGGVIFPPKPRDYSYNLPKKVRSLALRVALSQFNRDDKIKVVETIALESPKAKAGAKYLKDQGIEGKIIVVFGENNDTAEKALRNLRGVLLTQAKDLNILDLLKSEWLLVDKNAVTQLEQRLA